MIRAIAFDFGRVVSAQKPPSLFQRYEEQLGLAPDTINSIMFDSPFWQEALLGRISMDMYWLKIGPELHLDTMEKVEKFQRQYFADEALNPGILQILEELSLRHSLAIISNHPPGLRQWLCDWDMDHLFSVVVCSGDEGIVKPDPSIFHLALRRLGTRASDTLFIDDTREHVLAARSIGMHGIHFTTPRQLRVNLEKYGLWR